MSKRTTLPAPFLNLPFTAGRSVVTDFRMPHFVRRNELAMHLVTRGEVRVFISNGQRLTYPVGRLAFSWGAIPHRAEFLGRDVTIYNVTLPLGWVLRWGLPEPFTRAVLGGRTFFEPDSAKLPHDLALMERWRIDVQSVDPESRRVMLMEIEARLRRLAMDIELADRPRRGRRRTLNPGRPTDKVERMMLHIARHFASPLSVAQIAAAVDLHPDYASRLFNESTGTGLLDFLTQHRVATAQSLLASTDAKIADIALAAGFGSVSQFHVVFKRHTRFSPAGYRQTLRA